MGMNDVCAGDADRSAPDSVTAFVYVILADSDPDVLVRVASLLLLSNRLPFSVGLVRLVGDLVQIRAELRSISAATAESIRRKLVQLSCVADVTMQSVAVL
jgi:hypothetical protein